MLKFNNKDTRTTSMVSSKLFSLKKSAIFTGKHLRLSLFIIKLKIDYNTSVFM